jgi:prevent-host-death family protein
MGDDHGMVGVMPRERDVIAVSAFKARCLALLARVKRTGRPLIITRWGEPIAQVVPPPPPSRPRPWLGSFKGTGQIAGDIVSPAADEDEWEALRR